MQVLVSHDNHIDATDRLLAWVSTTVEGDLTHFGDRLTRVEVHLKDANAHKQGTADKHCTIEARPAGHQPVAVTHAAATLEEAVNGAAEKLQHALERTLGRLDHRKGQMSYGGPQGY